MFIRRANTLVSVIVLLALLIQPLAVGSAAPAPDEPITPALTLDPPRPGYLFRASVTLAGSHSLARLEKTGVLVLRTLQADGAQDALVLADGEQLSDLARLGFRPQGADELRLLVNRQGPEKRWLARSLEPLLAQADAIVAQQAAVGIAGAGAAAEAMALVVSLRAAIAALTPEQIAATASSISVDDDADGLTNTEEAWWCTDPLNPNSDGDASGYTDGQEVTALLDFTLSRSVRWGYGPPFGPPAAWPNFNNRDGTGVKVCNDGDYDTIPDYAEAYMVGTRTPAETTDGDKFDDGQELFGTTYCPGGTASCGYGSYPRVEYWNYIQADMPGWVRPPGDNPFVAAFPQPEVDVTANSWRVTRVTTITTSQGQMTQAEHSYQTSVTEGQSTSIADTVTWNNWQEVSEAVEAPLSANLVASASPTAAAGSRFWGGVKVIGGLLAIGAGCIPGIVTGPGYPLVCGAGVVGGFASIRDGIQEWNDNEIQNEIRINNYNSNINYNDISASASAQASAQVVNNIDFSSVVNSLDGVQYAIGQQSQLLARGLYDISYAISQPRYTETRTNGQSWGGAQTTTHEVYEEHTIAEGQAFTTGEQWSTAWAVDSSHAADLTFEFTVKNTGTEYARELTGMIVNVYIGDDTSPSISYPAWEKFPGGAIQNLFPGASHTFTADPIILNLDQMRRIDLGERLTVVVEDYSYGADELFYQNAVSSGMTVFIEDGIEDGDESVDSYVIPTWGSESVLDVLTRYFPAGYDAEDNINALWTPEFDGTNPPTWHEHFLSDIAWWNVYFTQEDAGNTPLKDIPAQAGGAMLFRFNRDSDRDGYNDRAEFRYYCALPENDPQRMPNWPSGPDYCDDAHLRPEIHPQPEVSAGYVTERTGDTVTVKLVVENTGTFDAYGIDAVMYSPDHTTTIGNNTVGGNGRVRPGQHVAVGSLVQAPDLTNWGGSTAKPYSGGNYTGSADRTYTFTAATPGTVGQGSTALSWSDGAGGSGALPVGSSYHAPLPIDVSNGLQIGLNTGTILAGTSFTVQALTPRDTFTYTVESEPFTPPVIVVSYSDPQGSHRFVTPVELTSLDASLAPYSGQMLKGLQLQIVTPAAFNASGANTTNLVVNNPHSVTIEDGHLYLNFVSDGVLVLEKPYTLDIPAGPTVFATTWSVSEFSPDYNPDGDNILIAFWTDSEDNIIDSAARPLNSFAEDPKPAFAMVSEDETWDFGTAQQGTLLRRSFVFGNTGAADLLTYVSVPPKISVPQTGSRTVGPADTATYTMTLNTASLPLGAYDGTITVRTSDPAKPTQTVHVTGNVTQGVADTPVGALQRPLDVAANMTGNLGEWKEYTHNLGPEPQTLHPVKVYSQDYLKLWGVGKYATAFNAGTASYDMFGDGRDGVMPTNGSLDYDNGVGVGVVNSGSQGTYMISVTDARSVYRINPGDVVLIHQSQGSDAGCWELNKAVSDFGGGSATYQLTKPLQCTYSSGGNSHAQIQRVPQYTDCPVTGTVSPLGSWNGTWGGILAVMCSGTANVSGILAVNGQPGSNVTGTCGGPAGGGASGGGFRGGDGFRQHHTESACGWGEDLASGYQGEGAYGPGVRDYNANGNGGGGGHGGDSGHPYAGAGGGGGNGSPGSDGQNVPGYGGLAYGNAELTSMVFGGGGGGGQKYYAYSVGGGGSGGGIIFLSARNLSVSGSIQARGGRGGDSGQYDKAGGGGAGGSIFLQAQTAFLGNLLVDASGGSGGTAGEGNGGNGGTGRIRLEFCETSSGTTTPTLSSLKLNCYIAEQIESAPYDRGRLNLAESGTNTYQVQYGRKLNWSSAATQETTLRVPAGLLTSVTLQALVSDLPNNAAFALDVGATGTASWSGTVSNNSENTSPNLASFFNAYWASHGAPTTGTLDVLVRVTLDRAGQVLLTNLKVTPTGSKLRHIRLPVQPQGYSSVTTSFTVSGGSGPLAVGVDVGANGSVDWTYTGSPAYPASMTTGNLATAVAAYLAGQSGEVDVPICFYLAPFATLNLTGFSATPAGQPDTTLGSADISFGAIDPVEGDDVSVSATLHNMGGLDTGRLTASFYATSADWGEWYIGSAFVPNVPAGGTAQAEIFWNTLGFTGTVPVRVSIDPFNRFTETDETNNEATANLTIKTRPDLRVTQVALSDDEPMAGELVTVTLTLRNDGQTAAAASALALYDGNPDAGGTLIGESSPGVAPATEANVSFTWTPGAAGAHKLFARADRDRQVNEFDEGNNDTWRDMYVGFASPTLIDSGGGDAYDPAYIASLGFGYLNGESNTFCGASSGESQRNDWSGVVQYRFDHLLPGHFYHLDLTLYECDGLGRQQRVRIDDNVISDPIDLSDLAPHRLSFRLDPAFYADRSIVVSVEELLGNDAVVSEINLYDIDYRYSDAGASTEADYSAARTYGPLDGVKQTTWGTLPYQSRRVDLGDSNPADDPDNELRYRYDGLRPNKRYQLLITVYQGSGTATVQQTVAVDSVDTGVMLEVTGIDRDDKVIDVPVGTYSGDGTITVRITRLNATAGAFINEIALEELTLLPEQESQITQSITMHTGGPNWFSFNVKPPVRPPATCSGVTATSAFTSIYGDAVLAGAAAPVGTVVEAYTPGGVKTGCFKVATEGLYGYMRVYGAEGTTPGMHAGDPIFFKINGISATPAPYPVVWQDDKGTHEVDLDAPDVIPVETLLAPLAGKYSKLQCENGTYLPPPADPRFNTCTTLEPGRSYLLWMNTVADLTITGNRVATDKPIALHAGYNWLGYLPTCELTVATALTGIASKYDILHSEVGTYKPPPADPAYNNFNAMAPGLGYMIHMTEAATLIYPAGLCGTSMSATEPAVEPALSCSATPTSRFTHFYGQVAAPAGAPVIATSPRGEVVGCGQVAAGGLLPYLRVYGAEGATPGMQEGEIIRFTTAGQPLDLQPAWRDDWDVHLLGEDAVPNHVYLPIIVQ